MLDSISSVYICLQLQYCYFLFVHNKHKNVVITLSQRRAIGWIDVASLLEMNASPTSVDNVLATLKCDVGVTLWQLSATLQSEHYKVATL